MNYLKVSFLFSLLYGNFIGWSSNNWIMIWFIMEIMFVFFIGFACMSVHYGVVELLMKYYISQVFISLGFISFLLIWAFNLSFYSGGCLIIVMMAKLGMFPFHVWVIMVLGKLNWSSFLIMMTIMKLLPLLMFYYLSFNESLGVILSMSVISGSVLGLNNLIVQKLMGYSSLVHLCWLILSMFFALKLFFIYFLCYLLMMLVLCSIFDLVGVYYVNQFKLLSRSFFLKFLVFFLVLSLGGFPPFMGFIIKWVLVSWMLLFNMKALVVLLIVFSLLSVLFYLELFFYIMMVSSIHVCWYKSSGVFYGKLIFIILGFYGILFFLF